MASSPIITSERIAGSSVHMRVVLVAVSAAFVYVDYRLAQSYLDHAASAGDGTLARALMALLVAIDLTSLRIAASSGGTAAGEGAWGCACSTMRLAILGFMFLNVRLLTDERADDDFMAAYVALGAAYVAELLYRAYMATAGATA